MAAFSIQGNRIGARNKIDFEQLNTNHEGMVSNASKALVARFLTLSLFTCVSVADPTEPSNDWVFVGPETPPERIRDVASDGEGAYVAVGDNSVVYWSPNGDNWHYLPIRGLHGNVRDVLYDENIWLLVTDAAEIGFSENGRDWEIQSELFQSGFEKVIEFEGNYIAIAQHGVATSTDGYNWEYQEGRLVPASGILVGAAVVGDKVVIVTANKEFSPTTYLTVYTSNDLINWTQSTTWTYAQNFDAIRLAAIEGMAIITYNYFDLYASRDLVHWEKVYDPTKKNADLGNSGYLESAFTYDGKIVFFLRPQIHEEGAGSRPSPTGSYYSLDADAVFQEEEYTYPLEPPADGGYRRAEPVFAAGNRLFIGSDLGSLYGSKDFLDWKLHFKGSPEDIVAIAKTDTHLVAITELGELLYSENAVSWVRGGVIVDGEAFDLQYNDGFLLLADGFLDPYVLASGRTFVKHYIRNRYNRLSYSKDGVNWNSVHVGYESPGVFGDPEPSVFDTYVSGNGTTIALSLDGKVYRSGDFENWEILDARFPDPEFGSENCECLVKRVGLELHFDGGAFWARSIENQTKYFQYNTSLYNKWYRSDDLGESWSLAGDSVPEEITSFQLSFWPRLDPNYNNNEWFSSPHTTFLYAFGRFIRVGEDYRIELSPTLDSADHSRLVNLSLRAYTGDDSSTLIAGFVTVGATGSDQGGVLLRGVGPSLTEVAPTLEDVVAPNPRLALYSGQDIIAQAEGVSLTNAGDVFDFVGAFPFAPDALDAALSGTFGNGLFTVHVQDDIGGVALAEIYRRPDSDFELVNLSGRAFVSDGEMTCIGGFVLEGETVRTILIRGVGQGLGIGGELADPMISLYRGSEVIASNDDWSGAHIEDFSDQAGAFALEPGSKDAALVLPLAPGLYTVHLTAKPGDSGVALLEIYDLGD